MKVYVGKRDLGDGDCALDWFKNNEILEYLMCNTDSYGATDSEEYNFPDDFDFKSAGIELRDRFYIKVGRHWQSLE